MGVVYGNAAPCVGHKLDGRGNVNGLEWWAVVFDIVGSVSAREGRMWNEWLVGFSGKRSSGRFTGSKCRFSPIFLCFYPLRPVVPPPRGARRFDDDETVIARITQRLRDIALHQAHDPRSQAKHLNRGDNA